jgi:hypothetical protein
MSGGLNRLFRANPQQFMTTHPFNADANGYFLGGLPGVRAVNLAYNGTMGPHNLTEVQPVIGRPSLHSRRFNAYYLPWAEGEAPHVRLGNNADYFFTPALTGCRLVIGAGVMPRVTHIDGGAYDNNQMDAICNNRSNGGGFANQRYWDNGAFYATVVVGVRGVGGWMFYAQNYNVDSITPLNVHRI